MVPDEIKKRWETAYRKYIMAWRRCDMSTVDDEVAGAIASASSEVAAAWRELHARGGLPWWSAAAALTAAEAFDTQATDWARHSERRRPALPPPRPVPDIPTVPVDTAATGACPPTTPIPSPRPRRPPLSA
jgi:hypothetical protein